MNIVGGPNVPVYPRLKSFLGCRIFCAKTRAFPGKVEWLITVVLAGTKSVHMEVDFKGT